MNRGLQAMERDDYDEARAIFKDAERHFRKAKDDSNKRKFDDLQSKCKDLEKVSVAYQAAQKSFSSNNFMSANASLENAVKYLREGRKIYVAEVESFEKNLESEIESLIVETEDERSDYWEDELDSGIEALNNSDYSAATRHLKNAKRESTAREQSSSGMMTHYNKVESYIKEDEGDKAMDRNKYVVALESYEAAYKLEKTSERLSKIQNARDMACQEFSDLSLLDLYDLSKEALWLKRTQASNRKCEPSIMARMDKVKETKSIVKDAKKVEQNDVKRALQLYKEAYAKIPASDIKKSIDAIEPTTALQAKPLNMTAKATTAPVTRVRALQISLNGVSIDDHEERFWGQIKFSVWEIDDNGRLIKQMKNNFTHQKDISWSTSKSKPLNGKPYPGEDKRISNIKKAFGYALDEEKFKQHKYVIKYSMNLTCNHKDNWAASDGDHGMGQFKGGHIRIGDSYRPELHWTKPFDSRSNRKHTFRAQFEVR